MRTFGELLIDCGEDRTRFLAEHIPDATLVELPGDDALPWIGAAEPVLNEIEKAVTGEVRAKRAGDFDRTSPTVDGEHPGARSLVARARDTTMLGQFQRM